MPYDRIIELPEFIQNRLPVHAQLIYKDAFNDAWIHYEDLAEWCENLPLDGPVDQLAHHAAWSRVRQNYEHKDGKWTRKCVLDKTKRSL